MPRELPKPPVPPIRPNDPTFRPQTDYTDLKIKTLAENIAKHYVPYALKDTKDIGEVTIDQVSNEAYLYVDNNGNPAKLLAVTVLKKEIQ